MKSLFKHQQSATISKTIFYTFSQIIKPGIKASVDKSPLDFGDYHIQPLINKVDLIKSESDQPIKYDISVYMSPKKISESNLPELINMLKILAISKKPPAIADILYKSLDKFNALLCSHQISKGEIIEFLDVLNHFRPKMMERRSVPSQLYQPESKVLLSKKHEEEYFRIIAPKDFYFQFSLFLKKHLTNNVLKNFMEIKQKFQHTEDTQEEIEDLLGINEIVFNNIELKVVDDIKNGRTDYDSKECIKLITGFSIASHGTNMLYEVLMRKVAKHVEDLTLDDLQTLANYLPHDLYNNPEEANIQLFDQEQIVERGRVPEITQFYNHLFTAVIDNIKKVDDITYLKLMQGMYKIKFIENDVVLAFLNNFNERINTGEEKSKTFFFDVLQLITYFAKNGSHVIDGDSIYQTIEQPFIKKYFDTFNLKEIATIFWIFFHLKILVPERIAPFEEVINKDLISYIKDPKPKIDEMGFETHLRYYNNHNIEPYDLEAINFFLNSVPSYKSPLQKNINKALELIELENTHPISRKWFQF